MKSYYQVKEDFLIDENRTYLFGFSQGGGLSYYLGAKYANIFTGIFSVSGRPFKVKNYSIKGKKLKKVASIIGTLDKTKNLLYDNVNIESYLKSSKVLFYLKQLKIGHELPEDKYLLEGFIWLLEEIGN
ncbi:hypothetical protein [Pontimicrobium aquaticum]|uniref:Phospholipase/carboxylesterase/thioesterase domain-containing protein n=1 Tax=Pontimicrobium aquaticum TaxID=2565367 RepID=A0A4V5LR60_9FLAO|nr:hypothetical protein [Pontimicrobium aquaticum]TJY37069.1 hypothetical protein E5167_03745 [Pontimicrobium aquaticum]